MSNDNESKLSRRGFIALGSAGVAAAVAMPGSLFAAETGASPLLLSVGNWSGSAVLEKVTNTVTRRLIREDWTGSAPATFPHLVMTTDVEVAL